MIMFKLSPIGKQLKAYFSLYEIDICHEQYSATIDFGNELSGSQIAQLERMGFEVLQENNSIYTVSYEN